MLIRRENYFNYLLLVKRRYPGILNMTITKQTALTKRSVISQIHGVYDPIGTVAPLLVNHKQLFCKSLKWDEPLNEELVKEWNIISENIQEK
uniref:DUF4160 domain-containing protein n=1 Tax=Heterorhabditis bacteriophora TaxID=37862 RepID=A0A1I7WKH4_HETBA